MSLAMEEQEAVASELVADAGEGWSSITAKCVTLGDWAVVDARTVDADGTLSDLFFTAAGTEFMELKEAMLDEHGGWFSATCEVQRDGTYHFTFNYDSLEPLAWYVDVEIPDDAWVMDLVQFPRPWAEIPDWHLVKQKYTEESWAAEVAANS